MSNRPTQNVFFLHFYQIRKTNPMKKVTHHFVNDIKKLVIPKNLTNIKMLLL